MVRDMGSNTLPTLLSCCNSREIVAFNGNFFKFFSVYQKFHNYFLAEVRIKETDQCKGKQ